MTMRIGSLPPHIHLLFGGSVRLEAKALHCNAAVSIPFQEGTAASASRLQPDKSTDCCNQQQKRQHTTAKQQVKTP